MTNHCSVLGVRRTATPPEVKAAYRAKAREAHPDRGGSAERFAAIQCAYDVLSDDKRRAATSALAVGRRWPRRFRRASTSCAMT